MLVTPLNKKFGKYKPGDSFALPDAAAKKLILAGLLSEVIAGQVRDQRAQTAALDDISPRTGRPRRQYNRRDMVAKS